MKQRPSRSRPEFGAVFAPNPGAPHSYGHPRMVVAATGTSIGYVAINRDTKRLAYETIFRISVVGWVSWMARSKCIPFELTKAERDKVLKDLTDSNPSVRVQGWYQI